MDKLDLTKLAKVLGMMGAAHDGEALAAARAAFKLLREAGVTWYEVLKIAPAAKANPFIDDFWPEPPPPPRGEPVPSDDHQKAAEMLMQWHEEGLFLYPREPDFLDTVMNWRGDLTEAQQAWFDKIVLRARRSGYPI